MENKPIVAIMYDFDKTLSPKDMQEYAFIPGIGKEPGTFWQEVNEFTKENQMDAILSYMYQMVVQARGKMLITKSTMQAQGKSVELYPGVEGWFKRINKYGAKLGLQVEHYIISSGIKEIIEGTSIAKEFKEIYAGSFVYDKDGVPVWPGMAINFTSKTQFLFRINKGVLEVTEDKALNEYTPDDCRRVPFRNMIYIGDGLTDVPCMKLTKVNGGHSIAVFANRPELAKSMIQNGRVDFVAEADYSKDSQLDKIVKAVLDEIAAKSKIVQMHLEGMDI